MMDIASLPASLALSTVRCSDPAEVAGLLPGTKRTLLPFAGDFEFAQTSLRLGSIQLVVVRRPPCTSEGALDPRQMGIAWAMEASAGLRLDGMALDQPALVTHGIEVPHHIAQPNALTIGAVFAAADDQARGWPAPRRAARADPVSPEAMFRLRSTVADIIWLAARDAEQFCCERAVAGMRQSLLGDVDHAFATAPGSELAGFAIGNHVRACRRANEFLRSAIGLPSNEEVAEAAGVTVRTLHNAMVAVQGISLQRFMTLNRLWAVRTALIRARPGDLVKTIAFDHGFWHLGRFSQTYRAFFGETPSATLNRATRVGPGGQRKSSWLH